MEVNVIWIVLIYAGKEDARYTVANARNVIKVSGEMHVIRTVEHVVNLDVMGRAIVIHLHVMRGNTERNVIEIAIVVIITLILLHRYYMPI